MISPDSAPFRSGSSPVRVGFAYDLFRSPVLGQWSPRGQTRWLQDFLTPAIELAGGTVQPALDPVAEAADAWLRDQVAAGVLPGDEAGWASLFGAPLPPGAEQWFAGMLGFDLVVGYELSPNQLRYLARHGIPVLDLGIDGVRFARRVLFRGRSNNPAMQAALRHFHVPQAALAADAGFLRATCGIGSPGPAEDLVFAGQVDTDSSLIRGGRIERIGPHLPRLAELAAQHRRVVVQPHPLASGNADVRAVLAAIPNSLLGEGSVYPCLLDGRTRTVATLSSSVAMEAALLGKAVVRLITPDVASEALGAAVVGDEVRLDSGIAHAEFWDALLARGGPRRPAPAGYGPEESLLRSALGIFVASPSPARQPLPPIMPGEARSLAGPANAALCRFGWSGVEPHGRWTDGPVALLGMDLTAPAAGIVLSLHAFMGPDPHGLKLGIRLVAGDVSAELDAALDHEALQEIVLRCPLPPGPVTIRLSVDRPRSPASLGISPDDRLLGVLLTTLAVLAVPDGAADGAAA